MVLSRFIWFLIKCIILWLSQWTTVVSCCRPRFVTKRFNQIASFIAFVSAIYSASVIDRALVSLPTNNRTWKCENITSQRSSLIQITSIIWIHITNNTFMRLGSFSLYQANIWSNSQISKNSFYCLPVNTLNNFLLQSDNSTRNFL